MKENESLLLLNKLIEEREEQFQRALSISAESNLLFNFKSDIDFLKSKREEILFQLAEKEK